MLKISVFKRTLNIFFEKNCYLLFIILLVDYKMYFNLKNEI